VSNRRLTSRDYKSARGGGFSLHRWREFAGGLGLGLAIGLGVALAVYMAGHNAGSGDEIITPTTRKTSAASRDEAPIPTSTDTEYSFYDRLPNFEVVVPEKERTARVESNVRVEQPGTYFLQIGSYKDQSVAERVQTQVAKLKVTATVQRVAVDNDVWHRVRVGPIKDLQELNRVRAILQSADLESLVVRIE
jgi:cell division protein FtsN